MISCQNEVYKECVCIAVGEIDNGKIEYSTEMENSFLHRVFLHFRRQVHRIPLLH